MGWFSKGILGGDEPMDYESDIAEILGFNYYNDDNKELFFTKENLEKYQVEIFNKFKSDDSSIIAFQTLSCFMVEVGAKFEPYILDKCIDCLERDDWKNTDLERKYHIDYLINILKTYNKNPKPTNYENEILFYQVYDGLEKIKLKLDTVIQILNQEFSNQDFIKNISDCVIKLSEYGIFFDLDYPDEKTKELHEFIKINFKPSYFDFPVVF